MNISFGRLIAVVSMAFFFSLSLSAQRQTPGRSSIEVYGSVAFTPGVYMGGGGANWCNHYFIGHTVFGLDVYREGHNFFKDAEYASDGITMVAPPIDDHFWSTDINASIGYMFRIWAPRNRVVVFSGGGSLLAGVRYAPQMQTYVKDANQGKMYSAVGFFIGIVPELQFEVFPFRNISLYISARPRARIFCGLGGKDDGWLLFSGAFGLKYYL